VPQIVLGAKNPLLKLTIITNPLCKSCIDAHKTYKELLHNYKDSVQLNFRFLILHADRTDNKTIISERLLQLYFENDIDVF
jgi:protein-disulfide isomerase